MQFNRHEQHKAVVFGYESFYIPSAAMSDTIQCGDHILSDTWAHTKSAPERGDIIISKFPDNPSVVLIKRLIGIPGDKITIVAGQVLINDVKTEEPYFLIKIILAQKQMVCFTFLRTTILC